MEEALGSIPGNPANWVWGPTPEVPVLGKLRQDNHKFKITLCYMVSSRLT